MVIHIDPQKEARLLEIANASGRTVSEVVDSAIDRVIEEQAPPRTDDRLTEEEHAAMMARIDEVRNLPDEGPDDESSVVDHDKVIYRIDR